MEKDSASLRIPPALAETAPPFCREQLFLQPRCLPYLSHVPAPTLSSLPLLAVSAQILGSPGSELCEELGRRWGVTARLWMFWDRFVEHQPCSHSSQQTEFSDLCNPSCSACRGLMPFYALFHFRDFPPDPSFSVQHFLFNFLLFSSCLFLFLSCFPHSTEILLNLFKTSFACQTFCAVLSSRKKAKLSVWKSIQALLFKVVYLHQAVPAPGLWCAECTAPSCAPGLWAATAALLPSGELLTNLPCSYSLPVSQVPFFLWKKAQPLCIRK